MVSQSHVSLRIFLFPPSPSFSSSSLSSSSSFPLLLYFSSYFSFVFFFVFFFPTLRTVRKFTRCQIRVVTCTWLATADHHKYRTSSALNVCSLRIKRSLITRYPKCELDANHDKVARGKLNVIKRRQHTVYGGAWMGGTH